MHPQLALSLFQQVRLGLTDPVQKWLPAAALYDEVGSALFDAITALPEYGLTRADLRLLTSYAPDIGRISAAVRVVELGSGNGTKTRVLLSAFPRGVTYSPVDVSIAALARCEAELKDFRVEPVQSEFLPGLRTALETRPGGPVLVAFLGSNIGNFERGDVGPFLTAIRRELKTGDTFLLGADLVKPVEMLLEAYDDPTGVTAAFNKNLLSRLNREFGANFCPRCFDHEARWNEAERRIEMHLRARTKQRVRLQDLTFAVEPGETIWTESSHKFDVAELIGVGRLAGFAPVAHWTDDEWPFAEMLFRAV